MIEALKKTNGVSRARATCDDCGRAEVVACSYSRSSRNPSDTPNEGQVRKKLCGHGWSFIRGVLRCQMCEAKRKVAKVVVGQKNRVKLKGVVAPAPSRQPTRADKRKIMDMLAECYDTTAEVYMQGDTDDTVADVLAVLPGWVAQVREEFFGPSGSNEDIEALLKDIGDWRARAAEQIKASTIQNSKLIEVIEQAKVFASSLERIKKAVGPRNGGV